MYWTACIELQNDTIDNVPTNCWKHSNSRNATDANFALQTVCLRSLSVLFFGTYNRPARDVSCFLFVVISPLSCLFCTTFSFTQLALSSSVIGVQARPSSSMIFGVFVIFFVPSLSRCAVLQLDYCKNVPVCGLPQIRFAQLPFYTNFSQFCTAAYVFTQPICWFAGVFVW